jgi:RNA polymerase sigma-70 factor (ECF subfamily)
MGVREEIMVHIPRLRRYARALLSNVELADDLVQDTLERGLRNVDRFRLDSDLRAWLFAIMHNMFVNQVSGAARRGAAISLDDACLPESHLAVRATQSSSLELRDLDAALQRLPVEQREVVLMVGLEEMSYAEVALALELPIGTVMSRLSRGRERLRTLMAVDRPAATLKVVK